MEVKIGLGDTSRELVFTSAQTLEEIEETVIEAVTGGCGLLGLTDENGRRYLVHTAKVTHVEIGAPKGDPAKPRRVGYHAPPPGKKETR